MRKKSFCVLAALVFVTATNAAARSHTGKVGGMVLDPNGRPAAGAEVIIERSDGSSPSAARTNADGRFLFGFVRAGLYDIRASRGATATAWKHNVLVHTGKPTAINLRLRPIRSNAGK